MDNGKEKGKALFRRLKMRRQAWPFIILLMYCPQLVNASLLLAVLLPSPLRKILFNIF